MNIMHSDEAFIFSHYVTSLVTSTCYW